MSQINVRDPKINAVLKLRGKPLNALSSEMKRLLNGVPTDLHKKISYTDVNKMNDATLYAYCMTDETSCYRKYPIAKTEFTRRMKRRYATEVRNPRLRRWTYRRAQRFYHRKLRTSVERTHIAALMSMLAMPVLPLELNTAYTIPYRGKEMKHAI